MEFVGDIDGDAPCLREGKRGVLSSAYSDTVHNSSVQAGSDPHGGKCLHANCDPDCPDHSEKLEMCDHENHSQARLSTSPLDQLSPSSCSSPTTDTGFAVDPWGPRECTNAFVFDAEDHMPPPRVYFPASAIQTLDLAIQNGVVPVKVYSDNGPCFASEWRDHLTELGIEYGGITHDYPALPRLGTRGW